jgi:hypothetical protein
MEQDDTRSVYFDPADIVAPDYNSAPWPKACDVCAFRHGDPQHLGAETLALLKTDVMQGEVEFYCVHRLSRRGLHRVCASAAALAKSPTPQEPPHAGE